MIKILFLFFVVISMSTAYAQVTRVDDNTYSKPSNYNATDQLNNIAKINYRISELEREIAKDQRSLQGLLDTKQQLIRDLSDAASAGVIAASASVPDAPNVVR